jgi:hypothetical protein
MFTDNIIPEKIKYIPHHIKMGAEYNTDMTINSAFKQILYQPDFYSGNSVRFIINSNGFLDPYSLNLIFSVTLNDNNGHWYQIDNSAHSFISKLIISCNGVELERIENYEYLNSLLFDISLDNNARRHLEHHGFGCDNRDYLTYGTGEECFPDNFKDILEKDMIKKYRDSNTIAVTYGIPDECNNNNNKRCKTFVLPLMSFIIGMNVNEYKYIPLHLLPYLQIEIVFNNYAIFNRTDSRIYFRNRDCIEYYRKKAEKYLQKFYFEVYKQLDDTEQNKAYFT